MDVGGVVTVAIPAGLVTWLAPVVFKWLASRGHGPFASGQSSDKLRAVILEVGKQTQNLHDALAKQNPTTGAYVVLESLADMRDHIVRQTPMIQQQVSALQQQNMLLERLAGQLSRSPGKYP